MSFKREGDDKSQLNILKKRRVADLLSHFIPEDEAALLKNGSYTCLVCSSRPVFNTVDVLTVHRQGKKHLEGLRAFYGKKSNLKNEITKRQHESYVKTEEAQQEPSSPAPLLQQTRRLTHHALLKGTPYNSCHQKVSKAERRQTNSSSGPDGDAHKHGTSACWKHDASSHLQASAPSEAKTQDEPLQSDLTGCPAAAPPPAQPLTAQRRRELEHYLKLKSDGWVKDGNGRWVKDDNVEFDSDEDEPTALTNPQMSG